MRLPKALIIASTFGFSLLGCGDVPGYWADLGVTDTGGRVMKTLTTEKAVVIYYDRPVSEFAKTCKDAFAPIVAKGWTTATPVPPGDIGNRLDITLSKGSERINVLCMVITSEKKELSVTFSRP